MAIGKGFRGTCSSGLRVLPAGVPTVTLDIVGTERLRLSRGETNVLLPWTASGFDRSFLLTGSSVTTRRGPLRLINREGFNGMFLAVLTAEEVCPSLLLFGTSLPLFIRLEFRSLREDEL